MRWKVVALGCLLIASLASPVFGFAELKHGLKPQTLILTYHDIIPKRDRNALWFDCTPDELRLQLDFLMAHGATFVTLDQLYAHLTTGKALPKNPVVITFADNYLGYYLRAWPILQQRRIPSAMFVHTGYVGSPIGRPKMDWPQLKELDRSGLVTIASQTVTHPADLRTLTDASLEREMVDSKAALERRLSHPIAYLAYPNGKFDKGSENTAREAGYRMAFSEEQTPAEKSPSIFAVARYVHTKLAKAWRDTHPAHLKHFKRRANGKAVASRNHG